MAEILSFAEKPQEALALVGFFFNANFQLASSLQVQLRVESNEINSVPGGKKITCFSGKSKLPLDKLSVGAASTFNTTCSFWITRKDN